MSDGNAVNFKNVLARVDKIKVNGLQRTKDDIVINSLKHIFKSKNLHELIQNAVVARLNMEKLFCFKKIGIYIDTSSGSKATSNYGYEVVFNVLEYNRITGKCGMLVGNNSGNLYVNMQSPNIAGRGECLQLEGKRGIKEMKTFDFSFIKPLFHFNGFLTTSLFKNYLENPASSYKQTEHGLAVDLSFIYAGNIKHSLRWEAIIRYLKAAEYGLPHRLPFYVLEQSGYSLKSAFKNTLTIDTRDNHILPTEGNLFQLKNELAGIGGNIGFVKNEIMSQFNIPLTRDISFQCSFAAGVIFPYRNSDISIADNFFIGGPLTLRGFEMNSVGPKVEGYATGSSLYFINAFHLYTALPHKPKKGSFGDSFRIHLFCNLGTNTPSTYDVNDCLERLARQVRLSYGLGLLYKFHNMARFELNYCIPHFYYSDDKLVDGVQFGFGFDFL